MKGLFKNLNEGRSQVKRKYGDYGRIRVNEKAPVRNEILKFIGNKFVTEKQMENFLAKLMEETGRGTDTKTWFKRNSKFFESFNNRGHKVWALSKYGKRVYEFINKKDDTINESIGLFKNSLNEGLTKANKISSDEYQKEKKIKGFDSNDWTWSPDEQLYNRVTEAYDAVSPDEVFDILDAAGMFTSTANDAAGQQWMSREDLINYLLSDHIPKKYHKKFLSYVKK